MGKYYDAQVAVREAWRRNFGHYPMDDPALEHWQREVDRHLQTVLDQAEEIEILKSELEALELEKQHVLGVPS